MRDKVIWLHHQQTAASKVLNVNKVRLVDPNIDWDQLNPRPRRQQGRGPRAVITPAADNDPPRCTSLPTAPVAPSVSPSPKAQQLITPHRSKKGHTSRPASKVPQPRAGKRGRDSSPEDDATPSTRAPRRAMKIAHKRPLTPLQPQSVSGPPPDDISDSSPVLTAPPAPVPPAIVLPSAHQFAPPVASTSDQVVSSRTPAVARTAHTSSVPGKKLHRQPPKHPLPAEFQASVKRARPFLPRGVKRMLRPTRKLQKKARIEAVNTLVAFLTL